MIQNNPRQTNDASIWGYGTLNGPNTWGRTWPLADEGRRQSPICLSWAAPEDPTLNNPRLMVGMPLSSVMV